jgi:uncharacterized protein YkwD
MTLIDALLAAIVLIGLAAGWGRGFFHALVELLAVIGGFAAAWYGHGWLAWWLSDLLHAIDAWVGAISFATVFIVVTLVLASVGHALMRRLPQRIRMHAASRAAGTLPGLANGLLQATVAVALLGPTVEGRRIAALLHRPAQPFEAHLGPIFDPVIRNTRRVVSIPDKPNATVALDYRVTQPTPRPDLQVQMLALVNAERATHGLKPVAADPEMAVVAEGHARDMFARGYFSHYSPEGGSMDDRLRAGNVRYRMAGENLALARSLAGAHEGLMRSPGHRANILRPQFGRLGIAVLDGGRHGLMVTQNFRD